MVGLCVTESTTGNMITNGAPMPEPLHHLPAEFPDGSPTCGLGYMLTARTIRALAGGEHGVLRCDSDRQILRQRCDDVVPTLRCSSRAGPPSVAPSCPVTTRSVGATRGPETA